jgi:hypothetical protein
MGAISTYLASLYMGLDGWSLMQSSWIWLRSAGRSWIEEGGRGCPPTRLGFGKQTNRMMWTKDPRVDARKHSTANASFILIQVRHRIRRHDIGPQGSAMGPIGDEF